MNKAYKFRIYPDETQRILIAKTFGCVRFIYNRMLRDKIEYYHQTQKKLNNTPAQYKTEFEWLREVDSLALANAQMNLQDAYNNFNLAMQAMAQALNFGKSVSDNGWGMFTVFLQYKLEELGKRLVRIDKFFASSQLCSICGYQNPETKDLSVREWTCPCCQTHHNRDTNAAVNIRNEGMRIALA